MTSHRIAEGSGINSGRGCHVIPWNHPKAQSLKSQYPFIGGRTPQGMGWVAVLFLDGTVDTFPKNRVIEK